MTDHTDEVLVPGVPSQRLLGYMARKQERQQAADQWDAQQQKRKQEVRSIVGRMVHCSQGSTPGWELDGALDTLYLLGKLHGHQEAREGELK